jgi:transketolase
MKAAEIRRAILENALRIGKGHVPSSLSWVEIGVALFYGGLKPGDRFVLSKTHGHLTLDAILADLGLKPDKLMWPGWPATCSGSLGQGLGMAAGIALAQKLDGSNARTFCVLSDAELHEGAIWEAAMFAAHHKLNLTAIVDDNGQSCANFTEDVLDVGEISEKFSAFGWNNLDVPGHSLESLAWALAHPSPTPCCVIAETIKGKGIPFMEGNPAWHHNLPKGDEIEQARRALA